MMNFKNVTQLRWSGPESIDMVVDFEGIGPVPFTAVPHDSEKHGRELYARAVAGDFGAIAPYTGPSEPEILAGRARDVRDGLLAAADLVVSNPLRWQDMSEAERALWAAYRQALLGVPQQGGFPYEIEWPEAPNA